MPAIKYGLTPDEVVWGEGVLSNDEGSRDPDPVRYFVRGGLTQQQAEAVVGHRGDYLRNAYVTGFGPLHVDPSTRQATTR